MIATVDGFALAGLTHVAYAQIGGDSQGEFIEWWKRSLGPALGI
jgi:hypothetical protein